MGSHCSGKSIFQGVVCDHPLKVAKEGDGVKVVESGLAEHLAVAGPRLPLVALRAIGRDGEVVAQLSPNCVEEKPVEIRVVGLDQAGLL